MHVILIGVKCGTWYMHILTCIENSAIVACGCCAEGQTNASDGAWRHLKEVLQDRCLKEVLLDMHVDATTLLKKSNRRC